MPGHRFDTIGVAPLIKDIDLGMCRADKAYDANWIIEELQQRGAKIVISPSARRKTPLPIDLEIYKWRHLIENYFCKLKEFKGIAMVSEKNNQNFSSLINLCAAIINSR